MISALNTSAYNLQWNQIACVFRLFIDKEPGYVWKSKIRKISKDQAQYIFYFISCYFSNVITCEGHRSIELVIDQSFNSEIQYNGVKELKFN